MTNIIRPSVLKMSSDTEAALKHWRVRSVILTKSHHTHMGRMLLRILCIPGAAPRFCMNTFAWVSEYGICGAFFQERDGDEYKPVTFGSTIQFKDELLELAHELNLSHAEVVELFTEARKWIGRDYRNDGVFEAEESRIKLRIQSGD